MSGAEILSFTANAMFLTLLLSMPPIAVATLVGTLVSLVQALTQIQEQNIAFAFKLVAIIFVIYFTARWLGLELYNYTLLMFENIPRIGR